MTALLLAPHYDDETLFAAYTVIRHSPVVVTCMGDAQVQKLRGGPSCEERRAETITACQILGADGHSWLPVRDGAPDAEALKAMLREVAEDPWDVVFAPAWEDGGHEDHNLVATLADRIWPQRTLYLTYRRGHGRSTQQTLSELSHRTAYEAQVERGYRSVKLMAMACYSSQVELDDCRPWFNDWEREWLL